MTTKTGLTIVTATRFSSSDYKKIKYFATTKRLTRISHKTRKKGGQKLPKYRLDKHSSSSST